MVKSSDTLTQFFYLQGKTNLALAIVKQYAKFDEISGEINKYIVHYLSHQLNK